MRFFSCFYSVFVFFRICLGDFYSSYFLRDNYFQDYIFRMFFFVFRLFLGGDFFPEVFWGDFLGDFLGISFKAKNHGWI